MPEQQFELYGPLLPSKEFDVNAAILLSFLFGVAFSLIISLSPIYRFQGIFYFGAFVLPLIISMGVTIEPGLLDNFRWLGLTSDNYAIGAGTGVAFGLIWFIIASLVMYVTMGLVGFGYVVSSFVGIFGFFPSLSITSSFATLFIGLFLNWFVVCPAEEVFFRGLVAKVASKYAGSLIGAGVSAVTFGLSHFVAYPPALILFALAIAFGFFVFWLNELTDAGTIPSIYAHRTYNSLVLITLFLVSVGYLGVAL